MLPPFDVDDLEAKFERVRPAVDFFSLRFVRDVREELVVRGRKRVAEPPAIQLDEGVMATVAHGDGVGYAATSDLSIDGIYHVVAMARRWAERSAAHGVVQAELPAAAPGSGARGTYTTAVARAWDATGAPEKIAHLRGLCARLDRDPRVTEARASFTRFDSDTVLFTSTGGRVVQEIRRVIPGLGVTAADRGRSQTRTFGRHRGRQGGLEVFDELDLEATADRIADEAVALLGAPECPADVRDLVLGPDQMVLQIHESIGHPLELDRVLGDERNFAGRSFVEPSFFGTFEYGSRALNVVFDPGRAGAVASYAFDDDGARAERQYIIRDGILLRGLGGASSSSRLGVPGVACARASGWNRPPVDRMANVHLEPGTSSFAALVAACERGIYMDDNSSWSIDDTRVKFQFGCEWGRLIENGELTTLVRNPCYRGHTTPFWRSLALAGDAATEALVASISCGKGEPNQLVAASHASPACLFRNVEVFGGEG